MAEVVFKHLVNSKKDISKKWQVKSAGLHAWAELPAVPFGQEACQSAGYDLSSHRSTQLTDELMSEFYLVLVMESWHLQEIQELFPNHAHKTFLLSEMTNVKKDIIDPHGSPLINHQNTLKEITEYLTKGYNRTVELSHQ
jgi:protein-tyrosine-phosphatase